MTPSKSKFGQRLRKQREALSLTQDQFAKAAKLTQPHLSKLEADIRLPGYTTIRRLVHALSNLTGRPKCDVMEALLQ